MTHDDIDYFKKKLQAEKKTLLEELGGIASPDKRSPNGWSPTSGNIAVDNADENELADKMEELADNKGIAEKLEVQLNEINAALERVQSGTYGICEVCK